MANSFVNKLNSPYYLEIDSTKRWWSCLRFSIFVFVFLAFFQPFGLSSLPEGIITVALGYGLTTFVVMAVFNILLLPLFPRFFMEEKWNVKKEILWNMLNVLAIGLANTLYSVYIGLAAFKFSSVFIFEVYTFTIAVFPVTLTVFLKESNLKNKFEKKSEELNTEIDERKNTEIIQANQNPLIIIKAENEKDKLEILLNDLVFIQSSDNYIEVHYQHQNLIRKKLIRNSLKAISIYLEEHQNLFRCHKSYLVNMTKVNHVSGNAQGYKLHLEGITELIPVSRQNSEELKRRLNR